MVPVVGEAAPAIELRDQHGQPWSLAEQTTSTLLVFFPFAFTPLCSSELHAVSSMRAELEAAGVQAVGISCDPMTALRVFDEQENLGLTLLSDFWPHGEVTARYGAMFEDRGFATRASFLIDSHGVLRWSVVNGPGDVREPQDYLRAIAELAG